MTSNENHAAGSGDAGSAAMRGEIAKKWGKFDEAEVKGLKSNDDLVTKVAAKYGLDAKQAQKQVDDLANGRQL